MKATIFGALLALCITPTCLAAHDKGGLGPQTDFKNMPPEQVLALLQNAQAIKIDVPAPAGPEVFNQKVCNGKRFSWSNDRAEHDCVPFDNNIDNPRILLRTMESLFRGCGIYAPTTDNSWGDDRSGDTCGLLGSLFVAIGNVAAARAVWEQAPGCHSHDMNGNATNGCVKFIMGYDDTSLAITWVGNRLSAYNSDKPKLYAMAQEACNNAHDQASCSYLNSQGAHVDMAAINREHEARTDAVLASVDEKREEQQEKSRESDARFNAVMGALQSMPGASDPNAIVNAGNQQAAQMRAIGDANATAQKQATQARIAAQQQAAQQSAAALQAQQQINQADHSSGANVSGGNGASYGSGGTGTAGGSETGYLRPISQGCVSEFWDPKFYNWLSFQNNCGQAIYLTWIAKNPSDGFGASSANLAPGQSTNSGWSQSEVAQKQNFALFVCPAGFLPVDGNTHQPIRSPNESSVCHKQ
jgi:hypothetical protein